MEKLPHCQGRNNPSFSSSLLDAIYRSFDEPDCNSPGSALSSTSKTQIFSTSKNFTPKPPPPVNVRHHFSASNSSNTQHDPPSETKTPSSIRSKICNLRDLRTPASPTTRLAAFLNTIFAGGGKAKKAKFAGGKEETARCGSKGGKQRSVEGGFEKRDFGEVPAVKRDRRLLVEELLRGFDVEEEEEEESDCESVSSSELFELESLSPIGRFRDGLPVYETTDLTVNRSIDHGFIV